MKTTVINSNGVKVAVVENGKTKLLKKNGKE